MTVNEYSRPVQLRFIDTYAPIDFGALYQIGAANNAAVEKALKELSTNLSKWSEFKSPSAIDTQKYYDLTVGHLKDTIQKAAENPDFLKTAAGRAELQGMINSVDYASLGQLKLSADNLRAGLEMRAKMEAEGRYNKNWDKSNIANYDTLNSGVFTDITPVKYMTANELSNAYYDNLKRGDIGSTWQDGVKYRMIGNTRQDLEQIYDTYKNDLINTPQGREYIQDFKRRGLNDEQAEAAFREMIIGSQMDRTLRPELKLDPGWELQERAKLSRKSSTSGVTRQDRMMYDITSKFENVAKDMPQEYRDKLAIAAGGLQGYLDALRIADAKYREDPSQANLVTRQTLEHNYIQAQQDLRTAVYGNVLKDEFKRVSGFDAVDDPQTVESFSRDGYNRGVTAALKKISATTGLTSIEDGGDKLFTLNGGTPTTKTTSQGLQQSMYTFGDSSGFVLPEVLFAIGTKTNKPTTKREAGAFRNESFPFEELIYDGAFNNVVFIPANSDNLVEMGGNMYVRGKLQIPVEQIENALGTGIWYESDWWSPSQWVTPFGRQSTRRAIEENYGVKTIEYGEDEVPYYEIDIYKVLPKNETLSYWHPVNTLRENAPSAGGIGSATMAKNISGTSLESVLNYSQP